MKKFLSLLAILITLIQIPVSASDKSKPVVVIPSTTIRTVNFELRGRQIANENPYSAVITGDKATILAILKLLDKSKLAEKANIQLFELEEEGSKATEIRTTVAVTKK